MSRSVTGISRSVGALRQQLPWSHATLVFVVCLFWAAETVHCVFQNVQKGYMCKWIQDRSTDSTFNMFCSGSRRETGSHTLSWGSTRWEVSSFFPTLTVLLAHVGVADRKYVSRLRSRWRSLLDTLMCWGNLFIFLGLTLGSNVSHRHEDKWPKKHTHVWFLGSKSDPNLSLFSKVISN